MSVPSALIKKKKNERHIKHELKIYSSNIDEDFSLHFHSAAVGGDLTPRLPEPTSVDGVQPRPPHPRQQSKGYHTDERMSLRHHQERYHEKQLSKSTLKKQSVNCSFSGKVTLSFTFSAFWCPLMSKKRVGVSDTVSYAITCLRARSFCCSCFASHYTDLTTLIQSSSLCPTLTYPTATRTIMLKETWLFKHDMLSSTYLRGERENLIIFIFCFADWSIVSSEQWSTSTNGGNGTTEVDTNPLWDTSSSLVNALELKTMVWNVIHL